MVADDDRAATTSNRVGTGTGSGSVSGVGSGGVYPNKENDAENASVFRAHFGTDMLIGAWLLLLSALIFYGVMAYYVSMIHFLVTPPAVIYNYLAYLLASIIYIVATVLFLAVSYPDAYDKLMFDVATAEVDKMSCMERYISGNMLLVASWLILFATLPIAVYPCWAMADGDMSYVDGSLYLVFVFFIVVFLAFFTVACFPENLMANGGKGSSMIYDAFCACACCDTLCCCVGGREWLQKHFGSDLLAGLQLIFVGSVLSLALSVYYVAVNYNSVTPYLWLLSSLSFTVGSFLFLYAFYPDNYGSTVVFDALTCSKSERRQKPAYFDDLLKRPDDGGDDIVDDEEQRHLVPH